ncbi:ABC-2 type transport system permease protein [Nakamurella panacisegetis]|uniref:Transport permease protein n=1 Tax=Nakamurella panacisegetis TaxID=1090615 RepID=A0A1H0RM49_9ACTN|nr:ABC transporter permease [Nakamurella panacisegetis]SDP30553.1 ABC-2 type transport system permease protein [Nakamurella panacisegetis]
MTAFRALSAAMFKGFIRDRMTVFFTILFPMFFIIIFGLVFTSSGSSKAKVVEVGPVPVIDSLPAAARSALGQTVTLTRSSSIDDALAAVRKGDITAAVEQQGNRLVLHYSNADQVASATVQGIFSAFINQTNLAVTGVPARYELATAQVEDLSLKAIQYIAPQMIAYGVSVGAVFGAAMTLITWREKKVLRRLRLAPLRTSTVIGSRVAVSLAVAVLQLIIFVGFSMLPFLGLQLRGAWYMSVPLVLAGTMAFLSIGLFVGAVAKTAEGGSGLANLITLPMAFLSGAFIPIESAPGWLVTVSKFMPLGYLVTGMKDVMVRGQGPASALVPIAILLAFAVVVTALASRLFRWDSA